MSFTRRIQKEGKDPVMKVLYTIKGNASYGVHSHCFLQLPSRSLKQVEKILKSGDGDIEHLGTILEEGFGEPSEERLGFFKENYRLLNQ